MRQGKLINKVAAEVPTLQHYIFSSLPDGRHLAGGKFQGILPYNAKAFIREDLMGNYTELWKKTTEVYVAFYFQNWLKYNVVFGPQKVCLRRERTTQLLILDVGSRRNLGAFNAIPSFDKSPQSFGG